MNETSREMPRYKCHKEVYALKIASAAKNPDDSVDLFFAPLNEEIGGESFSPVKLEMPAAARFHDIDDSDWGYYVVYDDTYKSWSPTEMFRAGYTRI